MEQALIILFIIVWAVLQARRKAIREQSRKQSLQSPPPQERPAQQMAVRQSPPQSIPPMQMQPQRIPLERIPTQPAPPQRVALGAVTAEENESPIVRWVDRTKAAFTEEDIPEAVRAVQEASAKAKQNLAQALIREQPIERVEEIVSPASSEKAYEITATVHRRIPLDINALRTFMVTREVLGPPRFRKPHRPGVRGR